MNKPQSAARPWCAWSRRDWSEYASDRPNEYTMVTCGNCGRLVLPVERQALSTTDARGFSRSSHYLPRHKVKSNEDAFGNSRVPVQGSES